MSQITAHTSDGHCLQPRRGNISYPPGHDKGIVASCGLASWLEIRGKWYRWEGTGSQLIEAIQIAPAAALDEWLEVYGADLAEFAEVAMTIKEWIAETELCSANKALSVLCSCKGRWGDQYATAILAALHDPTAENMMRMDLCEEWVAALEARIQQYFAARRCSP